MGASIKQAPTPTVLFNTFNFSTHELHSQRQLRNNAKQSSPSVPPCTCCRFNGTSRRQRPVDAESPRFSFLENIDDGTIGCNRVENQGTLEKSSLLSNARKRERRRKKKKKKKRKKTRARSVRRVGESRARPIDRSIDDVASKSVSWHGVEGIKSNLRCERGAGGSCAGGGGQRTRIANSCDRRVAAASLASERTALGGAAGSPAREAAGQGEAEQMQGWERQGGR